MITVGNSQIGCWLEIRWSGSKDLFSQFGWAKKVAYFHGFLEKWILWKSNILKRFIFVVFGYGNLISVKTYHDRLRNLGKVLSNKRFRFFDFGRGWGSQKGFGCCLVIALWKFFPPMSLWNFFRFCSILPFRVFNLESHFLFFFFHF